MAESDIFGQNDPDYEQVRCAHMFLERSGDSAQARQWKWADTRCDQQKSYICQFGELRVDGRVDGGSGGGEGGGGRIC